MKTLTIVSILLFSACFTLTYAQSGMIFSDDYTNSQNWTQVGVNVTVANGRVEYNNNAADGEQRRVFAPLDTTLNQDGTGSWCLSMDFYYEEVSNSNGSDHMLVGLTAGNQDPHCNCPDIPCTGYPAGIQDCIGIVFRTTSPSSNDREFAIRYREGSPSTEFTSTGITVPQTFTNYYFLLEHISPGVLSLSVFSDSMRTNHITGSPVATSYPNTITDLHFVQHSNNSQGAFSRHLNGYLDNLSIYDCFLITAVEETKPQTKINAYPNPSTGIFEISGLETTLEPYSARVFDVQGQLILEQQLAEHQLDMSPFPDGAYFVQLGGETQQYIKLIKLAGN